MLARDDTMTQSVEKLSTFTAYYQYLYRCYWVTGWLLVVCVTSISIRAKADCKDDPSDPIECPEAISAETTRGLGLGSGVRSSAISSSALAYNTAALPLGGIYHIEGSFDYQPSNDLVGLGASIVDSVTSKLAAGISIRGSIATDESDEPDRRDYDGFDVYLGLGYPLSDAISIGLAGRYYNFWRSDVVEEDSLDWNPEDQTLAKGLNLDASIRITPARGLYISALAYNVVFDSHDSPYIPVVVGGSVALNLDKHLSLGADTLVDVTSFDKPQLLLGAGIEYLAGSNVPLRLGYRYDTGREDHDVTGGIGYTDRTFGVDLSLRQRVSGGNDTRLMAAIRIYIY